MFPAAKPVTTLDGVTHESIGAAIRAAVGNGHAKQRDVARQTGLPLIVIKGSWTSALGRKRRRRPVVIRARIADEMAKTLADAAAQRGMTLGAMVAALLTTIAEDDMVPAIFDDGEAVS